MKKTISTLLIAGITITGLAACSSDSEPVLKERPAPTTTTAPKPAPAPAPAPAPKPAPAPAPSPAGVSQAEAIDIIRDTYPEAVGIDDATFIDFFTSACDVLDTVGFEDGVLLIFSSAEDEGLPEDFVALMIAGAVSSTCPQYMDDVSEALEA